MAKTPEGLPAPIDGALPGVEINSMAIYLHVPFCVTRCGYCDFNTYTADELRRDGVSTSPVTYIEQAIAELAFARRVLGDRDVEISSVFVGGGTPTLLASEDLGRFFRAVNDLFSLTKDAEVTVEANPDSVTAASLEELRERGATRLSVGMQSAVPHVLAALERTHSPENVARAVGFARAAGFEHVSVDLIYGTPGETMADWQESVQAAASLDIDHISAYALIVEEGTRLAHRIARGELVMPDDDETASKYELIDRHLTSAGFAWYEVSNWAKPLGECHHNLSYWRSENWWGIGPGAHSHIDGVRWWNLKHPAAYAAKVMADQSPAQAREVLSASERHMEEILLRIRLREGLPVNMIDPSRRAVLAPLQSDGLIVEMDQRVVLTDRGRLLADRVVRELVD